MHNCAQDIGNNRTKNLMKVKNTKFLIFAAIILVALNLRAAMTAPATIFDQISETFPISYTARSIIGMLPPICFALFGWLTPRLVPKYGLEKLILTALGMIFVGIIGRSLSNDIWMYISLSIVCLGGIGMSNILLPPIIKYHFPNNIGLITTIYTSLIYLSAGLPSLIAVPLTQAFSWRISTGSWAFLALLAMIPWVLLNKNSEISPEIKMKSKFSVASWATALAITIIFSVGAFNSFAMLAWLPEILTKSLGITQTNSGWMMSLFSFIGFFPTLFVPFALLRLKKPLIVIVFFSFCIVVANLGFIFLPQFALVWVIAAGIGLTFVSVGLTMINLHSRTKEGSSSLSGFVQGYGYLLGAMGPIVIRWLWGLSGGWNLPLWFLASTGILALVMGLIAVKPGYIEDFIDKSKA